MEWQLSDRAQPVAALLLSDQMNAGFFPKLAQELVAKSYLYGALTAEQGEDWAVLFAAEGLGAGVEALESSADKLSILPFLTDTRALYTSAEQVWLPVGVEPAVPLHVWELFLADLLKDKSNVTGLVIVPQFEGDQTISHYADVFLIGKAKQLYRLADVFAHESAS